jgi:hypothetical protein
MLSSAGNSISRLQEIYRSRIQFNIFFKKAYISVSDFPKIRDSAKKKDGATDQQIWALRSKGT